MINSRRFRDFNDSWATQFGTDTFVFEPRKPAANEADDAAGITGTIRLVKSGKCVGVVGSKAVVELLPCATPSALTAWKYTAAANSDGAGTLELVAAPGGQLVRNDCLGVAQTSAGDLSTWVVDKPFSVDLDATSTVTIMPYVAKF